MLIHCRGKHQAEFDGINSQAKASVDKAVSTQSDVRTLLKKSSTIIFDEAKQRELNKAIVYNLVVSFKTSYLLPDSTPLGLEGLSSWPAREDSSLSIVSKRGGSLELFAMSHKIQDESYWSQL